MSHSTTSISDAVISSTGTQEFSLHVLHVYMYTRIQVPLEFSNSNRSWNHFNQAIFCRNRGKHMSASVYILLCSGQKRFIQRLGFGLHWIVRQKCSPFFSFFTRITLNRCTLQTALASIGSICSALFAFSIGPLWTDAVNRLHWIVRQDMFCAGQRLRCLLRLLAHNCFVETLECLEPRP